MRGNVPAYDLVTPKDLSGALELLSSEKWLPFAGGTDLMVLLEAGVLTHQNFVNLSRLSELKGIEEKGGRVSLGALTTYTEIRRHPTIRSSFPLLVEAARETGAIAIQNRGTLGGNIANASPAADSPPALLAYDAELVLVSKKGERRVFYADFHQGYKKTELRSGEIIHSILLTKPEDGIEYYRKVGTRRAQAISKVCLAARARLVNGALKGVRLGWGSVAPLPFRSNRTENLLEGKSLGGTLVSQARDELAREISPIDDIRSTKSYRITVAQNLLCEFLEKCGTGSGN